MADVHAETVAWMEASNVKDIFEVCHNLEECSPGRHR